MAETASLPVLFSFRRCPYAMRARLALLSCGVQVRLREVVLRNKPTELFAVSPKGTVPVLLLPDGQVIEESREIMDWALAVRDPGGLAEGWGSCAAQSLIEQNDGPFKQALDRYKYPDRFPDADPLAARAEAIVCLRQLDARLCDKGGQLLRPAISAVDLAIFPFVRQFARHDLGWFEAQDWPHLLRWLNDHVASPLFSAVMQKYPPWQQGDEEPLFPAPLS